MTSKRNCGFCGIKGHNRRSCSYLKEEISFELETAVSYRKDMLDTFVNMGLGVGSLVVIHPYSDDIDPERNYLYMVKAIHWDLANHVTGNDGGRIIEVDCMDEGKGRWNEHIPFPAPEVFANSEPSWDEPYYRTIQYWSGVKLVSSIPAEAVKNNIPKDWCEVTNKELHKNFMERYKETKHDDYWKNYFNTI